MFAKFPKEEDGDQIIEYALIIAMVSIALVLALQAQTISASFGGFIGPVSVCCTAAPCI